MALLGRINWWVPARYKAWWERSGIGVDERPVSSAAPSID
jgi:hypothetical protein